MLATCVEWGVDGQPAQAWRGSNVNTEWAPPRGPHISWKRKPSWHVYSKQLLDMKRKMKEPFEGTLSSSTAAPAKTKSHFPSQKLQHSIFFRQKIGPFYFVTTPKNVLFCDNRKCFLFVFFSLFSVIVEPIVEFSRHRPAGRRQRGNYWAATATWSEYMDFQK